MRKIILYFIYFLLINVNISFCQDLKIRFMDGVYDLDNDDLVEFISFESEKINLESSSRIAYYEIDELGFPQLLWSLNATKDVKGSIVSANIADFDGSGTPEIVISTNKFFANDTNFSQALLYVYEWKGSTFSSKPIASIALTDEDDIQLIKNVSILDINADGKDEIAVALSGKEPVISILGINENEPVKFYEIQSFLMESFLESPDNLRVASLDYNRDGFSELLAFSQDKNIFKVQSLINRGGLLNPGPERIKKINGMSNILSKSISNVNFNIYDNENIIIPFQSGHILKLSMFNESIDISQIQVEGGPLSDLKSADFNQDGYKDLILISGEQGIITVSYGRSQNEPRLNEYFSINGTNNSDSPQIFSVIPEIIDQIYLGTVIAGGWNGEENELFYFELGYIPEYPEEILVDTYIPKITTPDTANIIDDVIPSEGIPLPIGILPSYVLPVHQTFAYTIPEDEDKEFFSFRWIDSPPRGMYFHYDTKSIEWVPDEMQLGAYQLSFMLKMKVGERVDIITTDDDGVVTYQVVPELATVESKFWVYVNDPPEIVSYPEITEFVAGDLFQYKVHTFDNNEDAFIRYTLEEAPEGMEINQQGGLRWKTDKSHINIYDVRIISSDGFDRDVQSFKLYSRGQVAITSLPENFGTVNEEYFYQLEVSMPEDKSDELKYSLVDGPYGMKINSTGKITWTPQSTQIDTQRFVVSTNHGVAVDTQYVKIFVNHPPIFANTPESMTKITVNDTFDFQLKINDPNEFDIIRYEPIAMPDGMRIDPSSGRILWIPSENNLDFSSAEIEISDGHTSRVEKYDFFVNSAVKIISEPPTIGTVGEVFNYQVELKDLNKGSLMLFDNITAINNIKNSRVFSVEIEDDLFVDNIDRYIGEFKLKKSILIDYENQKTNQDQLIEESVSRINLKKYVQNIFWEDNKLFVIINSIEGKSPKLQDVLFHFFDGNNGKPPKVNVSKVPFKQYTLLDFPDGMFINPNNGQINWTPSNSQFDNHKITFMVSDGFSMDEQSFNLYVNHPPTIISTAPKSARVDDLYRYSVVVEDKNSDRDLTYKLTKAPKGMQISRDGKISWKPKESQINGNVFEVETSDGLVSDFQETRLFVNISPTIITQPKPVALSNFEYRYRMVTEDLNNDNVQLRAIKIPKYAKFNPDNGMLRWKPRLTQRGVNNVIIAAIDERGATTSHEFSIHVYDDPSSQQFISSSWPLLLAFVGTMFSVGVATSN